MFASQDKVKSIRKLTESFDEESGEYPLIQVKLGILRSVGKEVFCMYTVLCS